MLDKSKLAAILEDEGLIKIGYDWKKNWSGLKSLSRSDLDAGDWIPRTEANMRPSSQGGRRVGWVPSKWHAIYPEMFYDEGGVLGTMMGVEQLPSQHRKTVFYVSDDEKHLVAYNGKKAYLRQLIFDDWSGSMAHAVAKDVRSIRSIEKTLRAYQTDPYWEKKRQEAAVTGEPLGEWMPLKVT